VRRPLLLPLVPLYAAGLAMREMRLERGWEKVQRLRWPVISVGNLSTGGSGKTPLVIALARLLTKRGFRVDVLSRGYGRRSAVAARVDLNGSAEEFGDEPLLIAREAGVPVYVAAERYEAGQQAEAESPLHHGSSFSGAAAPSSGDPSARLKSCPDTNLTALELCTDINLTALGELTKPPAFRELHILDDGFQHRQLERDVDVLLVNREDWHDHLLPAGNLRESAQAARRATVLAIPAEDAVFEPELRAWGWTGPVWRVRRRMDVPRVDGPVAAFCGIARPEQFFAGLEAAGSRLVVKKAFRDHYEYTEQVVDWLVGQSRRSGATALIATEKDAVRMGALVAKFPAELPLKTAGLRVEFVEEDAVLDWIVARLDGIEMRTAL
jgi:tetraacyldisaccharide 4'-kinase